MTMDENGSDQPIHDAEVKLSCEYTLDKEITRIQHSAYVPHGKNKWAMKVKGRKKNSSNWHDIWKVCKNTQVHSKHNDVILSSGSPPSDVVAALFGSPGNGDGKRMQLSLFGKRTSPGNSVHVKAYLLDDTTPAFQGVCSREKANGNRLLAPMASVFLSSVDSDVTLSLSKVNAGWTHDGEDTKILNSSEVWNSQSASVPPHCSFVLKQTDANQKSWACHVTLKHGTETAKVETSGNVKEQLNDDHCQYNDKPYDRETPKQEKVHLKKRNSNDARTLSRRSSEFGPPGFTGFMIVFLVTFAYLKAKGFACFSAEDRFLKENDSKTQQTGRKRALKQMRNKNNLLNRGFSDTPTEQSSQSRKAVYHYPSCLLEETRGSHHAV